MKKAIRIFILFAVLFSGCSSSEGAGLFARSTETPTPKPTMTSTPTVNPTSTPTAIPTLIPLSEPPEWDFTFTWDRFGFYTDKRVPFYSDEEIIEYIYSIIIINDNKEARELTKWFYSKKFPNSYSYSRLMKKSDLGDMFSEVINEESFTWLDWYIVKGNDKRFEYEDDTLHWRLVAVKDAEGRNCIYSPYGIISIKNKYGYSIVLPSEVSSIPPELWAAVNEGYTYFDVTGETPVWRCNFFEFMDAYGID